MTRQCIAAVGILLLLAGCFGETEPDTLAEQKMEEMGEAMDDGALPLRLDRSTTEDVIEYMGRSVDQITRGTGDLRELRFEMDDGSVLYFAMKPASTGGLILDHFNADD